MAATIAATALAAAAAPYREGPPPAHTGAFGEPSCSSCHFPTPDADSATLRVSGLPVSYTPDAVYDVSLVLTGAALPAGGFQLAFRFADGTQAGTIASIDDRVRVITERNVQYAQHTATATFAEHDSLEWRFRWTAPPHARPLTLHIAANAANDDASPLGDVIMLRSFSLSTEK